MDRMMSQIRQESNRPPSHPTLTEKEKAELVGKCYICKEAGHVAWNCPQGNKVKSGTGKPPGTSDFNIEFNDEVEVLESLPLGMMELETWNQPKTNWRETYPAWDQLGAKARPIIGDCYAMMAEYILTYQQPYSRDDLYSPIDPPYEHFEITKHSPNVYLIVNLLTGFQLKIKKSYLANQCFDISGWYAR